MLYRIKFICDEVDGFLREIKIDSDKTFLDLNKAILASCGYPDDQMTSFYVCDDEWERGQQITREDVADNSSEDEDLYVMADTKLSEFIEDEEQKFQFVFDPFNDRVFYIDVKELIPGQHLDDAVVVRSQGEAPRQVEDMDLGIMASSGSSIFSEEESGEFYGDNDFENDEFDADGFEISDRQDY